MALDYLEAARWYAKRGIPVAPEPWDQRTHRQPLEGTTDPDRITQKWAHDPRPVRVETGVKFDAIHIVNAHDGWTGWAHADKHGLCPPKWFAFINCTNGDAWLWIPPTGALAGPYHNLRGVMLYGAGCTVPAPPRDGWRWLDRYSGRLY